MGRIGRALKYIFGYPSQPVSRREFFVFAARNVILGASAGTLIWDQATKPSPTKSKTKSSSISSPSRPKQNVKLKRITLSILKKVQTEASMSSRYNKFIAEIIKLIEDDKITFDSSKTEILQLADANAAYNSKTNSLLINKLAAKRGGILFNASLIHELFHAYQDFKKIKQNISIIEAEAYLAGADYLSHHQYPLPESWLDIKAVPGIKGATNITFNIPRLIAQNIRGASFSSNKYKNALKLVADNYLWMLLYVYLYKSESVINRAIIRSSKIPLSASSLPTLKKEQKHHLKMIRYGISKIGHAVVIKNPDDIYASSAVYDFVAVSGMISNIRANTQGIKGENTSMNVAFETLKEALNRSTNIYKIDHETLMNGIN
jgi:hypothetical protein